MTGERIHPTAVVSPQARIADDVVIGPYAVVEDDVRIGPGCRLGAHAVVHRYVDEDLNRQFAQIDLDDATRTSSEARRAKELNSRLGPKGDPRVDVIIDLHTTNFHSPRPMSAAIACETAVLPQPISP